MKTKIITITFLFLMIATLGQAQVQASDSSQTVKTGFAIHSVNLMAGYYSPSMDYWNDTYFPSLGFSDSFGGNPSFGANITFNLPANFRTRVGASIWSGKVSDAGNSSLDALKIGFTRFNLGLFYAPESMVMKGFQPYAGLEVQENLIKNEYNINGTITTQHGQDISFAPVLGVDRAFGKINCGLEVKYNMGNYVQEESSKGVVEHKVSINGAEVALSIGYKF